MTAFGSQGGKAVIGSTLLVPNVSYKDTPVTITSWSYVTTTITLNVASHTFVAGDYIEVGGLTATTNIPNGVHLVTSVTATTIVFTYAITPTGTASVSSATVKGYVTTNGRVESIGVGQTWQDVTGSRAYTTVYTNTAGKPRFIFIAGTVQAGTATEIALFVNGVKTSYFNTTGGSFSLPTLYGIIPSGSNYYATQTAGSVTKWMELI